MAGESQGRSVIRPARPGDESLLFELILELAAYEELSEHVRSTPQMVGEALFGEHPAAEALIAEVGGETAGYAIFFPTFSTFLAIQGVWLEDLFVRPAHRGAGVGRALLSGVAARTRARGGERLEWSALDWNELALGFYREMGAERKSEWITHRLTGPALERVAGQDLDS